MLEWPYTSRKNIMNKRNINININILIVLLSSFIITIGIIIPTVFASSISISFNPKGGQGVLEAV